jgi:HSP20 family protein
MNSVRHTIWNHRNGLSGDIRQAFDRFLQADATDASGVATGQWAPRVDIREDAQRFVILADIPGVDPALIDISMDKGVLTITGQRDMDKGVLTITGQRDVGNEAHDGKFTRIERARGAFHRHFALPDSADAEGITANGKFGVLEIVIPKKAQATPRRITINAAH